ncbi:MAG: hypothetical protein AAFZ63_14015 [Bacteroidota bacterium]
MDRSSLDFVVEALNGHRRLLYYSKDEYARYLLERQVQAGPLKLQHLQQGQWARLLERPLLKSARGNWGDGLLNLERLQLLRSTTPLKFRLTFDRWGRDKQLWGNWDQTSRPGYNLVLQLNFAGDHNTQYQSLLHPKSYRHPFKYIGHPSRASNNEFTLAWARIDLSEDLSVALIEEVQNDWWRAAKSEVVERHHRKRDANGQWREWTTKRSRHSLELAGCERYLQDVLPAYGEVWAEAMLTATLQLLWEDIGVEKVFYHSFQTGCILKNCKPPRSMYTTLPKRFCFQKTQEAPVFLEKQLQKMKKRLKNGYEFWRLD